MRICRAQYALWAVIVAFGVMAMLAGCGAKGDLYLPPEQQTQAEIAPTPTGSDDNATQQ